MVYAIQLRHAQEYCNDTVYMQCTNNEHNNERWRLGIILLNNTQHLTTTEVLKLMNFALKELPASIHEDMKVVQIRHDCVFSLTVNTA